MDSASVTGPYITPFPYIATRSPAGLRVAYGQKNWPVEPAGDLKRLVAPWVPVDRVVRVLKQVWGFLVDEAVGMFMLAIALFHGCFILSGCFFRYYTPT